MWTAATQHVGCCCEATPGEHEVELGAPFPMMDRPPHEGEFSVSADRDRIIEITERKMQKGLGPVVCAVICCDESFIPFFATASGNAVATLNQPTHARIEHTAIGLWPPLGFALELSWRYPDVTRTLLECRADPNHVDSLGFHVMGGCKTIEMVDARRMLCATGNHTTSPAHFPALSLACARCAPPDVIRKLIEIRGDVNPESRGICSPHPLSNLAVWSSMNPHCAAQVLLEAKSDINLRHEAKGIFHVIELVSRAKLQLVGSSSALVHFYAEWTTTPLGFACFFGGEHLVEFLLQHDADPEIPNARGHTPFELACGHSVLTLAREIFRKAMPSSTPSFLQVSESGEAGEPQLALLASAMRSGNINFKKIQDKITLTKISAARPKIFNGLPSLIAITDQQRQGTFGDLVHHLPFDSWVIFRDYEVPSRRRRAFEIAELCQRRPLKLLVARDEDLAVDVNADGLHVPEGMLEEVPRLRQKHPHWLFTGACHSPSAAAAATASAVDAALFSPVFPTRSHPGEPTAGVPQLKEVIGSHPKTPIYALGGVNAETIGSLLDCPGCCGVAAIDLIAQLAT
eukprot:s242_g25.t4